jgi:hypothetical protein
LRLLVFTPHINRIRMDIGYSYCSDVLRGRVRCMSVDEVDQDEVDQDEVDQIRFVLLRAVRIHHI